VTVTQAGQPDQPILSVSPTTLTVGMDPNYAGIVVTNAGTGRLNFLTAHVTSGSDWLQTGRPKSNNSGAITIEDVISLRFLSNTSIAARTGVIRITASGALGSPVDVSVSQVGHLPLTIRVPDTGQTLCYNVAGNVITCPSPGQALYGQDGNYSINPMSYTKLDAYGNDLPDSATTWYMVRDNVTRLIWEMKTKMDGVKNYSDPHDVDNTYTWYNSASIQDPGVSGANTDTQDFIDMLNYARFGGYSDWRLPAAHELISIYSMKEDKPAINTTFFPNTMLKHYWSATDTPEFDNRAYATIYDNNWSFGGTCNYDKGSPYCARAVRGVGPTNQFITNSNYTVFDITTQLLWQKTPLFIGTSQKNVWDQAINYCETLFLDDHADWRLPTIRELFSIVDYLHDDNSSKIDCNFFTDCSSDFFYSSTHNDNSDLPNAMGLLMIWGVQGVYENSSHSYCRCVRGGFLTGSTFGATTGLIQISTPAKQELDLHINSSNSRGDTPIYHWLVYTYVINGAQSPLYLMSDRGTYELTNDVLTHLSNYTFTFDKDNVTPISSLTMSSMGLKAGDHFVYGYAYMNAVGTIFIDNVVSIDVK